MKKLRVKYPEILKTSKGGNGSKEINETKECIEEDGEDT